MNKITETLKLMMEALEMQIHGAESIIHSKLAWQAGHEALADHIADAGKVIAEHVKQEPVAWGYIDADGSFMDALDRQHGAYQTPLYAAPVSAKREWVELTDYEIVRLYAKSPMCDSEMIAFARAVIAAFKEKNK